MKDYFPSGLARLASKIITSSQHRGLCSVLLQVPKVRSSPAAPCTPIHPLHFLDMRALRLHCVRIHTVLHTRAGPSRPFEDYTLPAAAILVAPTSLAPRCLPGISRLLVRQESDAVPPFPLRSRLRPCAAQLGSGHQQQASRSTINRGSRNAAAWQRGVGLEQGDFWTAHGAKSEARRG